jgi:hypothetical protein
MSPVNDTPTDHASEATVSNRRARRNGSSDVQTDSPPSSRTRTTSSKLAKANKHIRDLERKLADAIASKKKYLKRYERLSKKTKEYIKGKPTTSRSKTEKLLKD